MTADRCHSPRVGMQVWTLVLVLRLTVHRRMRWLWAGPCGNVFLSGVCDGGWTSCWIVPRFTQTLGRNCDSKMNDWIEKESISSEQGFCCFWSCVSLAVVAALEQHWIIWQDLTSYMIFENVLLLSTRKSCLLLKKLCIDFVKIDISHNPCQLQKNNLKLVCWLVCNWLELSEVITFCYLLSLSKMKRHAVFVSWTTPIAQQKPCVNG